MLASLGRGVPWPRRAMAEACHGRGVPWPRRALAEVCHGRGVPWPRRAKQEKLKTILKIKKKSKKNKTKKTCGTPRPREASKSILIHFVFDLLASRPTDCVVITLAGYPSYRLWVITHAGHPSYRLCGNYTSRIPVLRNMW